MFADVRVVQVAREIRWARETLSEAAAKLVDIGRDDLLFEVTNLELQLHELHLDVMQAGGQLPVAPTPAPRPGKLSKRHQRLAVLAKHPVRSR